MSQATEAQRLTDWFATQSKFKTWEALARFLGIDSGTLAKYKNGKCTVAPQHREAMYRATGLSEFEGPAASGAVSAGRQTRGTRTRAAIAQGASASQPGATVQNPRRKAQEVLQILSNLKETLDFFAKGSPADRRELARIVRGQDVGYIMALFKALYNEDEFQRWVLHASYKLNGNGKP